ncbi:CDP-alcohol phosphatidyltransferase family protein [Oceanibacterium hippocampi]|uniref:CDP-alcohol phosphatidyltransferase n=1 Tax=Oceanibacterium hippocampi TaxID=745714 RepID=A0A1Y5U475_9PROT|nr:phosphatidylcholine/phosphatidylserine synthase [Oceanibacterium hippocampi]SLN76865.1 CDP-alcohol phosphatidyltransferase [Oceanibacterium hippocampi]
MVRANRRRLRDLPVNSLIPNILTVMALCAGLTAMRLALQDRWQEAVAAILIAGLLDGLDGRVARLLKGTSKFGAELDSLSDFVCFGVAPAFTLYLWTLSDLAGIGWTVTLALTVCCGLRLARFNTALEGTVQPHWTVNFFTGVASPAGAAMATLPMMLSFYSGLEFLRNPVFVAFWALGVAFLMVSQIPTFSFKRVRVRRQYIMPVLLLVGLLTALLVSYPWILISFVVIVYLFSLPLSMRQHRRLSRTHPPDEAGDADCDDDAAEEGEADRPT